jgi:hypothetical protein
MQYINVLLADGNSIQLIADVDVDVEGDTGTVHLADVLYKAILEKTREQEEARLKPGGYTIRLMAMIVGD